MAKSHISLLLLSKTVLRNIYMEGQKQCDILSQRSYAKFSGYFLSLRNLKTRAEKSKKTNKQTNQQTNKQTNKKTIKQTTKKQTKNNQTNRKNIGDKINNTFY